MTRDPLRNVSRRRFLAVGGGALAAVGASRLALPALATPTGVASWSAQRRVGQAGPGSSIELRAEEVTIDLAGRSATTWGYNGTVPGPLVRVRAGDTLRATVVNNVEDPTTIHWHGIRLVNAMDGVPDVTQPAIAPGGEFSYEFVVPDPGTFFFHPHVGLQLDRGLYAPLVVDDPNEVGAYDAEWILVLDDWTDGVGRSPDAIFEGLRDMASMTDGGGGHGGPVGGHSAPSQADHGGGDDSGAGMAMPTGESRLLGGHAGDVDHPIYLINGRPPKDPETFTATVGHRVRLRIINAGADTAFRFAVGGHRLTVTHADGFPIDPVEADAVLLGMGERIDAVVTVADGAAPVVARAEGKSGDARAVLRGSTTGRAPGPGTRVAELAGRVLTVHEMRAASAVRLADRPIDRRHRLRLDGNHERYRWTINGRVFDHSDEGLPIEAGERVRLIFDNRSTMWHPMHLHGHTFAVEGDGARKDTVVVKPGGRVSVDFDADNAGTWMVHCHNGYHQEAGMMAAVAYR